MTAGLEVKRLHWMQRLALVRHNLHAASRTSDFTFFKTLQAHAFLEGTDYVAVLTSLLDSDADNVLHTLDDLNAGMAYVHQDAFKACYDSLRASVTDETSSRRAKVAVDVSQQKQVADFGVDRMANAAISLIEDQPLHCQEAVANVWIIGATIIAEAVQVCIGQMEKLDNKMDDFILLEYSWQMVQTAVEASVSALRGVFNLMASLESGSSMLNGERRMSSLSSEGRNRSASMSSTTSSLFKRLSTALNLPAHPPAPPPSSARSSFSYSNPQNLHSSISHSFPMNMSASSMPPISSLPRKLSPIPPTPFEVNVNPFDVSFKGESGTPYAAMEDILSDDQSPLDLDPLSSAVGTPAGDCKVYNNPTFFRSLSRNMGHTPIAV